MIKLFKFVSLLEGLSYILLLFVAVPIKYMGNNETYVKLLGMPHGLLFVGYLMLAYFLWDSQKWNSKEFFMVCALSVLPFGTFFVGKYLKE
jgi:integral membrane protein